MTGVAPLRAVSLRFNFLRSAFKIVRSTPTGNKPLGRSRRRWEDIIRMNLKEIGISTRNCVDSAQDREWRDLVNAALNLGIS